MMRYDAVIFDLDGTLLNTLDDLAASTNRALDHFGLPQRSLEEVRQFVGNGLKELMRRSLPGPCGEAELERHTADLKDWYAGHDRIRTRPYGGILPLLDRLNAAGCRVGVVSNKMDSAVQDLCRHYFGGRVAAAVGERQGMRRKPAPDTVELALDRMGVSKEGAVYIGDSEVDVATAKNTGLPCICVTWGFRSRETLLEAGAKTLADTPQDLLRLLIG